MLGVGRSTYFPSANGFGFFPVPLTLSPGNWLLNPNRSSNTMQPATLDAFRDHDCDHCVLPKTNPTLLFSAA